VGNREDGSGAETVTASVSAPQALLACAVTLPESGAVGSQLVWADAGTATLIAGASYAPADALAGTPPVIGAEQLLVGGSSLGFPAGLAAFPAPPAVPSSRAHRPLVVKPGQPALQSVFPFSRAHAPSILFWVDRARGQLGSVAMAPDGAAAAAHQLAPAPPAHSFAHGHINQGIRISTATAPGAVAGPVVLLSGLLQPVAVAADHCRGFVYWAQQGDHSVYRVRVNLASGALATAADGSTATKELVLNARTLHGDNALLAGLALDLPRRRLLWSDSGLVRTPVMV
jgi:hypothetical protein